MLKFLISFIVNITHTLSLSLNLSSHHCLNHLKTKIGNYNFTSIGNFNFPLIGNFNFTNNGNYNFTNIETRKIFYEQYKKKQNNLKKNCN